MHEGEIVCAREKDGKAKERRRAKEETKRQEERSWWIKRDGTRSSSYHVVYQRHFILIFRERGLGDGERVGMVEERETESEREVKGNGRKAMVEGPRRRN